MNYYLAVFNKYAVFNGRAQRAEYWCFFFSYIIISFVLGAFGGLSAGFISEEVGMGFLVLGGLYFLAVLIPGIAVTVRRLHDTNRSGWWLLLSFVPLGPIVLLVFMASDSQPSENKYGPNPKEIKVS